MNVRLRFLRPHTESYEKMMNQADAKQDGDELSPALELLHITALKTNELRNNEDSA